MRIMIKGGVWKKTDHEDESLKAAIRKRKRRGQIDYNAEIPFEKQPPPGFYDADEDELVNFPTTIEELEGERRADREASLRNKIAQRQDAPSAILQMNDPETVRKRSKLNLPAPQIPDHELAAIAKIGIAPRISMTPSHMDMPMHESGKFRRKKEVISGLKNLPQPKNEYHIVVIQQPVPEDDDEEEKMEEDMSDRLAREKAEEEARQQTLLKKPHPASLADDEDNKYSWADVLIRKELLSLLQHDNVKYPLRAKPEPELKEADKLIKSETEFLRMATGYVEAHTTCLTDMLYFPTRAGYYGLSSVANNMDKLAALQNEFENVKKKMDDETKRAQRHEQKIKVLTNGYQIRSGKLWTQIEATLKQMDTAGTKLECFQALQKQEKLAASHRISNLREEVQKQKDLERISQKRYGDLLQEVEKLQHLVDAYKLKQAEKEKETPQPMLEAEKEEETAQPILEDKAVVDLQTCEEVINVENHPPVEVAEVVEATLDQYVALDDGTEPVAVTDVENSMQVDSTTGETGSQHMDDAQ